MNETILDNLELPEQKPTLETSNFNYPPLLTRLKSAIIDLLLVLIVFLIASNIFEAFPKAPVWIKIVVFIGMVFIYEPLLTSMGCTLGQLIMGIRVRSVNDKSKRINMLFSLFRYLVKFVLGWLSCITVSFSANKRAVHDMVGRSIVVYKVSNEL